MIRFFVYENLKHWIQGSNYNKDIGVVKTALCGATAGAASVFGNTPIDVVKTRMQVISNGVWEYCIGALGGLETIEIMY